MGDRQSLNFDQELLRPSRREGLSEVAGDFARSIVYGAVQGPVDGITQLIDRSTGTKLLPALHLVEHPDEQKFGTARWHAQQVGAAIGMAAPLLVLHNTVSKLSGPMAERCAGSELTAHGVASEIKNSLITGTLCGGLFCPSDSKEDFASARLKAAATSGITFGAFSAGCLGLKSFSQKFSQAFAETSTARIASASLAGIPAGALSAQTDSILHGRGNAKPEDLLKSAYSFAVVGGTLSLGQSIISNRNHNLSEKSINSTAKNKLPEPTQIDPELIEQVQKLYDHFHRKDASNHKVIAREEATSKSETQSGTETNDGLNQQVQKLYDFYNRKSPSNPQEHLETSTQRAETSDYESSLEEALSSHAQALLELHNAEVERRSLDLPESYARQKSGYSTKGARLADSWIDALPESVLRFGGKDRTEYWRAISQRFEARAIHNGVSRHRQAETFTQIERLLRPKEKSWTTDLTPVRLKQLAREILENVSNPNKIDQGDHPTCVLNSIESVMASNHPEKYARLVADLGLTGESYKNGIGIKLPERCMAPDKEARELMRKDGERCYASQLAQYYLANLHWSQCTELPTGDFADPGTVTYEPMSGRANRAALYVDGKPLKITATKKGKEGSVYVPIESPEVLDNYIVPLFRQVVPRGQLKVIDHTDGIDRFTDDNGRRTVTTINTPEELEQALLSSQRGSVICGVRSELLGGDNGWHAVVIRDFEADTGTVYVDNSWGQAAHHNGKTGQQHRLTINELFKLMEPEREGP